MRRRRRSARHVKQQTRDSYLHTDDISPLTPLESHGFLSPGRSIDRANRTHHEQRPRYPVAHRRSSTPSPGFCPPSFENVSAALKHPSVSFRLLLVDPQRLIRTQLRTEVTTTSSTARLLSETPWTLHTSFYRDPLAKAVFSSYDPLANLPHFSREPRVIS